MGEVRNDAAIMAALGRQMTRAVQKQAIAASNLANSDTPGYRAQEVQFSDLLDQQVGAPSQMVATNPRHLGGGPAGSDRGEVVTNTKTDPRLDGNNVQVDRELLALGRAGGEFNAAQTMLAAKFRLVRYAINEGR